MLDGAIRTPSARKCRLASSVIGRLAGCHGEHSELHRDLPRANGVKRHVSFLLSGKASLASSTRTLGDSLWISPTRSITVQSAGSKSIPRGIHSLDGACCHLQFPLERPTRCDSVVREPQSVAVPHPRQVRRWRQPIVGRFRESLAVNRPVVRSARPFRNGVLLNVDTEVWPARANRWPHTPLAAIDKCEAELSEYLLVAANTPSWGLP